MVPCENRHAKRDHRAEEHHECRWQIVASCHHIDGDFISLETSQDSREPSEDGPVLIKAK